jgi:hypothetical protein
MAWTQQTMANNMDKEKTGFFMDALPFFPEDCKAARPHGRTNMTIYNNNYK